MRENRCDVGSNCRQRFPPGARYQFVCGLHVRQPPNTWRSNSQRSSLIVRQAAGFPCERVVPPSNRPSRLCLPARPKATGDGGKSPTESSRERHASLVPDPEAPFSGPRTAESDGGSATRGAQRAASLEHSLQRTRQGTGQMHEGDGGQPAKSSPQTEHPEQAGSTLGLGQGGTQSAIPDGLPAQHAENSRPVTTSAAPGHWPAGLLAITTLWGPSWFLTAGLISAGYAALAAASAIAAGAFLGLAPGNSAAAGAVSTTAAAVASVNWVDVALRTAAGLADGGLGREQVLLTLQDAGASPAAGWAVRLLLPPLCGVAAGCRSAAGAVQSGLPWLGSLTLVSGAAAGLGVLLVMAAPLRPYLAALLRLIPAGRPRPSTLTALRAGGVTCMVAVLTGLQAHELRAPLLGPSVRGTAAAAAAASPLLQQHGAMLYGALAVASDAILPLCTAAVAEWVIREAFRIGPAPDRPADVAADGTEGAVIPSAGLEGATAAGGREEGGLAAAAATPLRAVKILAVARLLVDAVALAAVMSGQLSGNISAVKLLGMLWLFQTAQQL